MSAAAMSIDLTGRAALVTGASRGIGAAVARAFSHAGAAVALAARDAARLETVVRDLNDEGGRAIAIPTDVTDRAAVSRLVDETVVAFGRLDYACNNASGGGQPPTPLADLDLDAFDAAVAVNLRGVLLAMQHEIPAMLDSGGGAIVNMTSTAALQGVAGLAPYVATKHGIEGLTRVAALDYANRGVRVNAIAPGPILTDHLRQAGLPAQRLAAEAMPMQRVGQPDEVAAATVWLCSEQAGFITGTTLVIDGGKMAGTPAFGVFAGGLGPRQPPAR